MASVFLTWVLVNAAAHGVTLGSISLAWDPNPEPNIAGYRIYYGTTTRNYTLSTNLGPVTNVTITGLSQGVTYFFAATARDTAGLESGYSAEVVYQVPVSPNGVRFAPGALRVQPNGQMSLTVQGQAAQSIIVQSSTNLVNWTSVSTNTFASSNLTVNLSQRAQPNTRRFYRALLR